MTFTNEISISDITSSLSVVFVILGGIFGCYQWRKNVLLKRAGYINDLTEKIRTDNYIKDVIYMFDYGEEWYSMQFHLRRLKEQCRRVRIFQNVAVVRTRHFRMRNRKN